MPCPDRNHTRSVFLRVFWKFDCHSYFPITGASQAFVKELIVYPRSNFWLFVWIFSFLLNQRSGQESTNLQVNNKFRANWSVHMSYQYPLRSTRHAHWSWSFCPVRTCTTTGSEIGTSKCEKPKNSRIQRGLVVQKNRPIVDYSSSCFFNEFFKVFCLFEQLALNFSIFFSIFSFLILIFDSLCITQYICT